MDNLALVALFLASGTMLLWPEISRFAGGGGAVGTLEATRLMNQGGSLVLDVREAAEFAAGHLPRARNIPLAELNKRVDEIARFRDKPVLVTCKGGTRSGSACRMLKGAGFTNVVPLKGGIVAWEQASLPVER
jgi:rhodanese-related sulfurtransferase